MKSHADIKGVLKHFLNLVRIRFQSVDEAPVDVFHCMQQGTYSLVSRTVKYCLLSPSQFRQ